MLQLLRQGAIVNHLSMSRKGSTADGTTPLHACAVMKFNGQVARDHYFESARVLLLSGGNPYQENASGSLPSHHTYDLPKQQSTTSNLLVLVKRSSHKLPASGNLSHGATGLTPIEVAANQGNVPMKLLLEGCALFKGTLAFQVPRMLGDRTKDRQVFCSIVESFSSRHLSIACHQLSSLLLRGACSNFAGTAWWFQDILGLWIARLVLQ